MNSELAVSTLLYAVAGHIHTFLPHIIMLRFSDPQNVDKMMFSRITRSKNVYYVKKQSTHIRERGFREV